MDFRRAGIYLLGNCCCRGNRLEWRTASTSEKPAVSLKATSPSVANSGRAVAKEPGDATVATAIVADRADLLMAKCIDGPIPWDQFDTNYFQHRCALMRELNQSFRDSVTMFIPSQLTLAEDLPKPHLTTSSTAMPRKNNRDAWPRASP
jgi:hypothetical protein